MFSLTEVGIICKNGSNGTTLFWFRVWWCGNVSGLICWQLYAGLKLLMTTYI